MNLPVNTIPSGTDIAPDTANFTSIAVYWFIWYTE